MSFLRYPHLKIYLLYNIYMSRINSKIKRDLIYKKTNYRCAYCGVALKEHNRSIDHIISLQNGGTNDESNLIGSCIPCNLEKGQRERFTIY